MAWVETRTVPSYQRKRLLRLIPPRRCSAISSTTREPCGLWAIVGAEVCRSHGGNAPQVRAAAAVRVSLAEALLHGDRRHPSEVLAASLHTADALAERTVQSMAVAGQETVTAEVIEQLLEANKIRATMAKLVLDSVGAEGWSAQEAYRQQGDALAKICRAMARRLGFDASDQRVADAFEGAVAEVVFRKRRGPKAIEGKVV